MEFTFQHPKQSLTKFLEETALGKGWSQELARGTALFLKPRGTSANMRDRYELAHGGLRLISGVEELMEGSRLFKASSFNYIAPLELSIPEVVNLALDNANYWADLLSPEFFREGSEKKERAHTYRAEIGDSGFTLTAKPGSGAGTFSLDLAIAYDTHGDQRDFAEHSHELWRVGIDTQRIPGRVGRIIRTGTAVKPDDQVKQGVDKQFGKELATTPRTLLTFTALYAMYELGFAEARALTTEGAVHLSSLGKSKSHVSYTDIHKAAGLMQGDDPNWLIIDDLQVNLSDRITSNNGVGMKPHEPERVDAVIRAFNSLVNVDGRPFPVKIFQERDWHNNVNDRERLAREISALMKLQGRGVVAPKKNSDIL